MHGFGVYQFGNGHRYEGAWHEGRRQGFGTYTFRNGETQSGHWQNGVLEILSAQNTHLGSPYAVTQSRVLNAVQVSFVSLSGLYLASLTVDISFLCSLHKTFCLNTNKFT
ncbi:MORN repeat-containing protein 4-like [Durio zibethinus]|uniref:MORN repeat-containing protein 4-like n=1 Tax=Durio zibethinus TaxID=66656 RepID=A0A6P5XDV9_DURZI|nr:MORN repeat-containing protein 4-like [Durio zibethinus]